MELKGSKTEANLMYAFAGEKAPEKCPVCDHPQAYFQLEADNY